MAKVPFPTPGEIFLSEFLEPMEISQAELAAATDLPKRDVQGFVDGSVETSADSDRRLHELLGTSIGFWAGLQGDFDSADGRQRT